MSKKDKKLMIIGGVGLIALVVVLVFQFRPKSTPATAQAAETSQSLSLRPQWNAVAKALKTDRQIDTTSPVGEVKLPRRDPFKVSELLRTSFGPKKRVPRGTTTRPADAAVPSFNEQKWLQEEAARIDARKTHFLSTYVVKIIMQGTEGYEASVFDGREHRLLKKGVRVEDCVVAHVTADSVHLKSVPKESVDTMRTVECSTLDIDGKRAAMIDGKAYRVGEVCRGWLVKQVREGSVVLEMPPDSPLRNRKPLPYSV